MVAIDSAQDIPQMQASQTPHTGTVVLFAFLGAVLIAVAALSLTVASSGNGWHNAAEMVSRFSLLLFVVAMTVEPLARLIPTRFMQAVGRERSSLTLGFAAAAVVGLVCVAAPGHFGGEPAGASAVAYCAMTAMILVVMMFSTHPSTVAVLGEPASRALQRISTAYFWIAFAISGIEHLVGPHIPDSWYGVSLLLLTGALLLRFADSFVAHWRSRTMAEKVA